MDGWDGLIITNLGHFFRQKISMSCLIDCAPRQIEHLVDRFFFGDAFLRGWPGKKAPTENVRMLTSVMNLRHLSLIFAGQLRGF